VGSLPAHNSGGNGQGSGRSLLLGAAKMGLSDVLCRGSISTAQSPITEHPILASMARFRKPRIWPNTFQLPQALADKWVPPMVCSFIGSRRLSRLNPLVEIHKYPRCRITVPLRAMAEPTTAHRRPRRPLDLFDRVFLFAAHLNGLSGAAITVRPLARLPWH